MADKPSKALVLYGDGLARFVHSSHTHLHSFASKASCGFLTLPNAPPSESNDERSVREFAVLLDACQAYLDMIGHTDELECQEKLVIPTLSDRFMGMKAALITNNSRLKSFGGKLGFTTMQLNELSGANDSLAGLSIDVLAFELLKLLGFQDGKMVDSSQYDLVFVHIADDVDYINSMVGSILQIAQPGSEVGSRLHVSVLMSYGCVSEADGSDLSVLISMDKKNSFLSKLIPRQSYTMKGENPRNDVRHHSPMLISQMQYAVTRKDMADKFSFKDFREHGCNLAIPADRFLYEVAFKLWKAPKYGA
ncbi:uncharacterized protein LOC123200523 isoform X2 [Mangifera indica]|uniref:uncharacterized protein LOC123200523 isoform X2 n=1 Tax=Mangifera indica TaxID=29780 RepID=UPI001CFA69A0|nr:uncharacterized protein LOC123200523 isoform X2 [Mangifera indica]